MYDVKEKRLMSDVNYLLLTNFNFKQLFCPVVINTFLMKIVINYFA